MWQACITGSLQAAKRIAVATPCGQRLTAQFRGPVARNATAGDLDPTVASDTERHESCHQLGATHTPRGDQSRCAVRPAPTGFLTSGPTGMEDGGEIITQSLEMHWWLGPTLPNHCPLNRVVVDDLTSSRRSPMGPSLWLMAVPLQPALSASAILEHPSAHPENHVILPAGSPPGIPSLANVPGG